MIFSHSPTTSRAPLRFRALLAVLLAASSTACATREDQRIWRFDRLDRIGGHAVAVEGDPRVVATPLGRAVAFDGVDDALFIPAHPLAGARTFTFEALFRPDGGSVEQRWFHLAEGVAGEASPQNTRILFEVRIVGEDRWYLDAFARGPGYNQALMAPDKLHRTGCWYHVAQVYDGKTYRSYVNGALQTEAEIAFTPQGPGRSSVGVRINRVDYFKGAVREARFTPGPLPPERFEIPASLRNQDARCTS